MTQISTSSPSISSNWMIRTLITHILGVLFIKVHTTVLATIPTIHDIRSNTTNVTTPLNELLPFAGNLVTNTRQEDVNASSGRPDALQGSSNCFINNFIQGFGIDDTVLDNQTTLNIQADPSGAAGVDRLVAVVNAMIEVRSKDGRLTYRNGFKDFFSVLGTSQPNSTIVSPKVVYDEHAQRFVVIVLQTDEKALSRFLLAVSKNERPDTVSDWYTVAINSAQIINGVNCYADFPGLEVDEEAVYITANMLTFLTDAPQGVRLWIVAKGVVGGIYSGGPPTVFGPYNPYQVGGIATTTMPAQVHGSGGAGTSIGTFLVSNSVSADGTVVVQVFTVRNPLGIASFSLNEFQLGRITQISIPNSPQPGSIFQIEANDGRTLDAVWRNNKLWMTFTINPRPPNIDAFQATSYWVRIDTTNGNLTLDAHDSLGGEAFSPTTSTSFPAVALNKQGQIAFGYSASSSTMFAGAHGSIFSGTKELTFTVYSGLDSFFRDFGSIRNPWGEYSGISVDPVDDSFWIFNQFADVRGSSRDRNGRWGTAWARVFCTVATVCIAT